MVGDGSDVSSQLDAAFDIAEMVSEIRFADLPSEVVETVKRDVLDTLGCTVAGSTAAGAAECVELAREWGGTPQARILGYGDLAPAPVAAFVNGTMGHALDFDDNHDEAVLHVGPASISAALAVGSTQGRLTGRDLITSVAVGADVIIRLSLATTQTLHESGFMFSPLYGHFGATAAGASVLGLTREQVVHALGIVYAQAAGNLQPNIGDEHALTKRMQIGFAARAGVYSALLAKKGLTGAQNSLEGRYGLFNLYQRGNYDRSRLLDGLGERFEIKDLSFKQYPCCGQIQNHIDAALELREKYDLQSEDIERVDVFVNAEPHFAMDPMDLRRRPQEEVHAQFSIPYSVGVALAHGRVRIADYTLAGLRNETTLELADKVWPIYDPDLPTRIIPPARMEITTRDGRVLTTEVAHAKGHPSNPMTFDDLCEKFRDCCSHSANPISSQEVEMAIEMCATLEDCSDVDDLITLVAPARRSELTQNG